MTTSESNARDHRQEADRLERRAADLDTQRQAALNRGDMAKVRSLTEDAEVTRETIAWHRAYS